MLTYLESLNQISRDFVFKGGNLLWVYIGTPRATTDLDLATMSLRNHDEVGKILRQACTNAEGIQFTMEDFKGIEGDEKQGAEVTIGYETREGAQNVFQIDIVYALPIDVAAVASPIQENIQIRAATLENIISDKLSALNRFGAGNTRIKDLDDLWRLADRRITVKAKHLSRLLEQRGVSPFLNPNWINPNMERAWSSHHKRYSDLPENLDKVFSDVNSWLVSLTRGAS